MSEWMLPMQIWHFSKNWRSIGKLGLMLLSFFLGHVHPVSFWKDILYHFVSLSSIILALSFDLDAFFNNDFHFLTNCCLNQKRIMLI